MPRTCCIQGCFTGHTRNPHPNLKTVFFDIPKELSIKQQWLEAILPFIQGRKIRKEYYVCELHFKESDLIRYHVTDFGGGRITKIPRERPLLRKGSIPSIFVNFKKNVLGESKDMINGDIENSCPNEKKVQNVLGEMSKDMTDDDIENPSPNEKEVQTNKKVRDPNIPYNLLDLKNDLCELVYSSSMPDGYISDGYI